MGTLKNWEPWLSIRDRDLNVFNLSPTKKPGLVSLKILTGATFGKVWKLINSLVDKNIYLYLKCEATQNETTVDWTRCILPRL